MENSINNSIIAQAKEKVNKEFENLGNVGNKEKAVSSYVHNVICDACDQSEEFASVVVAFKRTLKDCLQGIMKGVGNAISDIDVYRKAVQFYFPGYEVHGTVTITPGGERPSDAEINKEPAPEKKPKPAKEPKNPETKSPLPDIPKKHLPKKEEPVCIQLSLF